MSTGSIIEREQAFIPHPQFVEDVQRTREHVFEIVQAYFPTEGNELLTRNITFADGSPDGSKSPTATVTFKLARTTQQKLAVTTDDANVVTELYHACNMAGVRDKLLCSARLRCQRSHGSHKLLITLTLKGRKENGIGPEYEFVVEDQKNALELMRDYGKDHMLHKTRYVKHMDLGGKTRRLELDRFRGNHEGRYKLEIEHASAEDFISPEVSGTFASSEVTNDLTWRNRRLAGNDKAALRDLNTTIAKLEERQQAQARLDVLSHPAASQTDFATAAANRVKGKRAK